MKKRTTTIISLVAICNIFLNVLYATVKINTDVTSGCAPLTVNFSANVSGGVYYYWAYNDGTYEYDTVSNPSHVYSLPGNYTVKLYAYDSSSNYIDGGSVSIVVNGAGSSMNISPKLTCPGSGVKFDLSFTAQSYQWNLGDGTTSVQPLVEHSYADTGLYNVSVIVQTTCGIDTIQDQVHIVNYIPITGSYQMTLSKTTACPTEPIGIGTYGTPKAGTLSNYAVDFGDGNSVNSDYTSHAYQDTGKYAVKAIFTNTCGIDTTITDSVHITRALPFKGTVSMNVQTHRGCLKTEFNFSTYVNYPQYIWNFGDGTQATASSVAHFYKSEGTYPVSLTVVDYCGNDSTIYDTVVVDNNTPFKGYLLIYKDAGEVCPGTAVNFSASSGYDNYYWDFGNGITSNGRIAKVIYNTAGIYPVSLTATNACGQDSTVYDTIKVHQNVPIGQYLSYSIDKGPKCPTESFAFQVNSTNLKSAVWDFGDNNISRKFITTHQYYTAGTYPVTLTAQNWCGADTTIHDSVLVMNNMPLSGSYYLIADMHEACPNTAIGFSAGTNPGENVMWDFGDGTGSAYSYPDHIYSSPGTYHVSLTYTNLCGADTVLYDSIMINGSQSISNEHLTQSDTAICPGNGVTFTVSSSNLKDVLWNFGDSTTSSGTTVTHSFSNVGKYNISYVVTNNCGVDSTFYTTVDVRNDIKFDNNFNENLTQQISLNQNAYLAVYGNYSRISEYKWNLGDGYFENITDNSVSHRYNKTGLYNVSCTVINGCGDQKTFTGQVFVDSVYPDLSLDINPQKVCPGNPVEFSVVSSSSDLKNCTWQLDDGFTTKAVDFMHAFSDTGVHKVNVTATDLNGNSQTFTGEVRVTSGSQIDEVTPDMSSFTYCPNDPVTFNTTEKYNSLLWNFGDGSSSGAMSTQHIYSSPGTYDASVTAANSCGDTITNHFKIFIKDNNNLPGITFTVPSEVCPGMQFGVISLNFSGSYSWNTNNLNYRWDMGDGSIYTTKDFTHEYSSPGIYTINLTVSNNCGASVVASQKIRVTSETHSISPEFSFPQYACPNSTMSFSAYDDYQTYSWNFGDGNSSSEKNPSHSYSSTGLYTVTLTAADECGNTGTAKNTVMVVSHYPIDQLYFNMSSDNNCPGDTVGFNSNNEDGITYSWNFGDGITAQGSKVTHVFASTGPYDVKLSAQNVCGDTTSINRTMEIGNAVASEISYGYSPKVCPNENAYIYFDALAGNTYKINFGDGTMTSTLTRQDWNGSLVDMAEHQYSTPGTYDISYEVTKSCGQKASGIVSVLVGHNLGVNAQLLFDDSKDYCTNSDISFTANGGAAYTWYFGDGTIFGTSGTISTIKHQYKATGKYPLSVKITNGCGDTATYIATVNVSCIGDTGTVTLINNVNGMLKLNIYPNPAQGQLHIVANNGQDIQYVEIHDLLGEELLHKNVDNSNSVLDISSIKPGIYLIDVHTSDQEYICKFVKK